MLAVAVLAVPHVRTYGALSSEFLVIDCGPEDEAFHPTTGGGDAASWVPLDGSYRSGEWTSAGPQSLGYSFTPELSPGHYRLRCYLTVQTGYQLSLSALVNDRRLFGPIVLPRPGEAGPAYPLLHADGFFRYEGGALRITLDCDQLPQGDRLRAIRLELVSLGKLTEAGNVVPAATIGVDSELSGCPASCLSDGVTEYTGSTSGRSWASAETPADHWATFVLPQAETVDHAVLCWPAFPRDPFTYNTARELKLQYRRGAEWVTACHAENPVGLYRTVHAFRPVSAAEFRVLMPAGRGPVHRPNLLWLNEVELFRPGTWAGPMPPAGVARSLLLTHKETRQRLELVSGGPVPSSGPGRVKEAESTGSSLYLPGPGDGKTPRVAQALLFAGDQPVREVTVTVEARALRGAGAVLAVFWDGLRLPDVRIPAGQAAVKRALSVPPFLQSPKHALHLAVVSSGGLASVDSLSVASRGRLEVVASTDRRVAPPPYEPTPRLSDADLFASLDLDRPGLAAVKAQVVRNDLAAAKQELVRYFVGRTTPPRPPIRHDGLYYPDVLPPDQSADKWLAGYYYLYKTSSWVKLGRPFNWYLPEGNASDRYYLAIQTLMRFVVDRWQKSGDPRYLRAYLQDYRSFYETAPSPLEPPVFPAHYLPWSGIESAMRIEYGIEDYFRICESPLLDTDHHMLFYKSVLEHARFLTKCDGGRLFPANHQMGHLLGLEEITAYFPEFREAGYWRQYTQDLLRKHHAVDLYADGGNVDTALDYAVMVSTKLYTYAYLFADLAGIDLGPEWGASLQRQYRWCLNVTAPDGGHLGIGDCSPRLDFPGNDIGGRTTTAVRGALLFGDPVCKYFTQSAKRAEVLGWAQQFWGSQAADHVRDFDAVEPELPDWTSVNLPDTGWTIMRSDWSPDARYLFVDHHRGGHIHHNMNDVNVLAFGRQFLTDPGMPHTYVDNRYKEWYARTVAHNTVLVDNQEMPYAHGDPGTFFTSDAFDYLAVKSDVYRATGVEAFLRQVLFVRPDFWIVDDSLAGTGQHTCKWLAHYQPMPLEVDPGVGTVATTNREGANLGLSVAEAATLSIEQATGWMNIPTTSLCEQVPDAPYVALVKRGPLPLGYGVLLVPVPQGPPTGRIEALPCAGGVGAGAAYRVETPTGAGVAAFRHGAAGYRDFGPLATDARAAYVSGSPTSPSRVLVADGTRLSWQGADLVLLPGPASLAAMVTPEVVSVWTNLPSGTIRLLAPQATDLRLNGRPVRFSREGALVVFAAS